MNPLNYGSLEASKRLVDAGIVIATDIHWVKYDYNGHWSYVLKDLKTVSISNPEVFPAPSMAEVWKELPRYSRCKKVAVGTIAWIGMSKIMSNENPTDALIDLLIYLKGKEDKSSC